VKFSLFDSQYRVVFLQALGVDRDVVALWRLADANDTEAIEQVDGPPDRRAGGTRRVDEFGNRELRLVSVGEKGEYLVGRTESEHVCLGTHVDTDRGLLFR